MHAEVAGKAPRPWVRGALVGVWVLGLTAALGALWRYKLTPGRAVAAAPVWPAASDLLPARDRPTLLMFAHPRCVCTRASLTALGGLVSRFGEKMATTIVFARPDGVAGDWTATDTWRTANAMPGVRVALDPDGRQARLFAATTSGHVMLFDTSRRLAWSGGITPGRGHVGDNPQLAALTAALAAETAGVSAHREAPWVSGAVYGCPLAEGDRTDAKR